MQPSAVMGGCIYRSVNWGVVLQDSLRLLSGNSARSGNADVPVNLFKEKQGYTVIKMEEDKSIYYTSISAGVKFRKEKKFRYGIPVESIIFL